MMWGRMIKQDKRKTRNRLTGIILPNIVLPKQIQAGTLAE